jgi:hypothetical protein
VDATYTYANDDTFKRIFYKIEKTKIVISNQKGIARLTADYYEYTFILGYQAIIVGEFLLSKSKCELPKDKEGEYKKINIKEVGGYKEYINFSEKATVSTPGKVTGRYYSVNPLNGEEYGNS